MKLNKLLSITISLCLIFSHSFASLHITTKTFHSDIGATKLKTKLKGGEEVNELVSTTSTLIANNDININTIDNLNLIGTSLKANKDINLVSTKGNVNIQAKQSTNTFNNKTATGYLKTSQTTQTSSNIEADNINITSNSLHVKASNLTAKESLHVNVKKDITIEAGESKESLELKHKVKGTFLGGKLKLKDTLDNTSLITSTLKAKNINLNANQINLLASQIKADEVKITTEVLRLISQKNTSYEDHFKDSSGLMTRTIATKGHIKEEIVKAQIEVTKNLILNNKDITNKLQNATQVDNIIKTLSSQHNLTHEQIELVKAYTNNKEWDESHTSLSAVGAIIVAIVVTVCTAGMGTAAVASVTATQAATFTATQVITAAATQAVVSGIATQVASAAITGESFKLDVSSLVKGALVAGVLTGVTALADSAQGIDGIEYKDLSTAQKITRGVTHSTIKAGVNSGVYGTDFVDSLKMGLATQATNMGFEYVGDTSEFKELHENNEYFKEGAIGKVALHGLAGGIGAELTGGKFEAGAASAAVRELISPLTTNQSETTQLAVSQLTGTLVGAAIDGDAGANTGYNITTSAEKYNRQLHEKEIKFIKENAKDYAKEKFGTDNPSEEQILLAKQALAQTALILVDNARAKTLGEVNEDAKTYLEANLESVKNVTEIEKSNFAQNLPQVVNNKDSLEFYKDNVHVGIQTDIKEVIQQELSAKIDDTEKMFNDSIKNFDTIVKKVNEYQDNSTTSKITKDILNSSISGLTEIGEKSAIILEIANLSSTEFATVYNISQDDAIEAKTVLASIIGIDALSSVYNKTAKVFTKKVKYNAPKSGTGNNYTVYQQDVDLDLKVPNKPYTNREWMKKGKTPYIKNNNGNIVQLNLHHSQQKGGGPLFEVTQTTHKNPSNKIPLHPYGKEKSPIDPVDRKSFDNVDRPNYWKDRVKELEKVEKE